MGFDSIADAIEEIRRGRVIIVVDDEDRENEGDLTIAAEKVTPGIINFMAKHGRGLICLAMTGERLDDLQIPLMVGRTPPNTERRSPSPLRRAMASPPGFRLPTAQRRS